MLCDETRSFDGYSDRGKDRMSVWKTAMIFFGQMQGKTPHSK
jgi:hypothetical protein